jgi:hypothetical protein
MTLQSPNPFPTEGLRKLSDKEKMQQAQALNCTLPKDNKPACTGQIHVGIFFDGTGNNMKADFDDLPPAKRKHSNVVRLFQAYRHEPKAGYFHFYIPGVGTKFPEIGDGGTLGGGFALTGEQRITWALTDLLNAPKLFVLNSLLIKDQSTVSHSMVTSGTDGVMRRTILNTWQDKLNADLKDQKPRITLINLSVFGFSRGAAEARAFCNWLFEVCKQEGGGWTFAGIPIRLHFLGILDTVASVGITDMADNHIMEGRQSWADHNMGIHPAIEQCVHFVAGHEVRASFPLDSVRDKKHYPANVKEVMYPGGHSDVGGGYAPNVVGISPDQESLMATIPGARMYQEARLAGVPLLAWDELGLIRQKNFTASPQTISDFNNYLLATNLGAGAVEALHKKHMSLYLSYRYKYRNALESLAFYKRADQKGREYLRITTNTFHQRLKTLSAYPIRSEDHNYDVKEAVKMQKSMMKAAGLSAQDDTQHAQLYEIIEHIDVTKLTPAIEHFFENYVHDSMAGFIGMKELSYKTYSLKATNEFAWNGHGIMRFRSIFAGD